MNNYKKTLIEDLIELTGRDDLFHNVRFINHHPVVEVAIISGISEEQAFKNANRHTNDKSTAIYDVDNDEIIIRDNKLKYQGETGARGYNHLLMEIMHEAAHRIQFSKYIDECNDQPHGIAFQKACLDLGLDPQDEAYDATEIIEYDVAQCNIEVAIWKLSEQRYKSLC